MKKIFSYIKGLVPLLIGLTLIIVSIPGLITTIKTFSSDNAIILILDLILVLGSLIPITLGLNILIAGNLK